MYAIIASGGKQYKVAEGETLKVEKLEANVGSVVDFDQVLMLADGENFKIGTPFIEGAKVTAKVAEHARGKKIEIIKFRRRKHYLKHQGHRQDYTAVQIDKIST
jgi:large subunit ribosomal protein L21